MFENGDRLYSVSLSQNCHWSHQSPQCPGELGVKSMNGLYSDSDRATFQSEIEQLKEVLTAILLIVTPPLP